MNKELKILEVLPKCKVALFFYKKVKSSSFDYLVTIMILCNAVTMSVRYESMSAHSKHIVDSLNYIFAVFYNLEMFAKMIGLRRKYFKSRWDKFDFIIVIATDIGIILDLMSIK
jgi:hypothetical protein